MLVIYHQIGETVQVDRSLMTDDLEQAKAVAKQIAENHPGRTVFISKAIGFMKAPETQAEWVEQ